MNMLNKKSLSAAAPLAPLALLALLALAGGCEKQTLDKVEQNESIFGFIPTPPSPAEAARWSQDPYDADKRFRGTNLLANAPFGGEDVYTRTYRMKLGAPPAEAPDPDSGVRGVAARALSLHGNPADAELIIPLLKDPQRNVRLEGVRALQRIHNPKAIDPLITSTNDKREEDFDIRAEACTALGQYPERKVLQALIAALNDDYLVVNRAAQKSLYLLTGQELGDDTRPWLKWLEKNDAPFAGQQTYTYPIFERDPYWFEYVPFVPQAPNELPGSPVGMNPAGSPLQPTVAVAPTVATATPPAAATTTAPAPQAAPAVATAAPAGTLPPQIPAPTAAPSTAAVVTPPAQPIATAPTPAPAPTPVTAAAQPIGSGPQPRPEPLPPVPQPAQPATAGTTPAAPTPAPPAQTTAKDAPPAKKKTTFVPGKPVEPAPPPEKP